MEKVQQGTELLGETIFNHHQMLHLSQTSVATAVDQKNEI